ncbi:ABC transporter ATP-binding protein [Halobacillus sp. GSS1]|uniref:ABC transporter ATP-binding protein n=1 Tax=Halobacillus sp. GSS1 TaxID=2815919 RepID=UPI001F5D7E0A|nr:ABC transporter ATP-binding protein [Halobacillus sp. GSS1]
MSRHSKPKMGHPHGLGSKPPKVENLRGTLRRIWLYMAEERVRFIIVLAAILVSSSLSLLGPYLLGLTVDMVIESPESDTLLIMLGSLLIVYLFHSLFLWLQNYWMIGIAQNAVQSMRSQLFSHVQLLPVLFFQKMQQGELMSRLTNDIENVSRTLNTAIVQFFTSLLTIIGTLIIMLWLSPMLTLLTLTIIPVMYFGMKWITNRTGPYFKKQQKDLGEVNGYVEEMFSGQSIIKMFSKEEDVISEFGEKNKALRTSGYYAQVYTGFIPKLMNMLNNVSFAIIVGAGGILALNGSISIGIIVTFTTYSRQFTRPLNDLANQFNMILSAVAGADRVFQVLDEKEERLDEDKAQDVSEIRGNIRFEHVDFSYEGDQQTLSDITFEARAGQTVALVGPTGAGKTTIISLLSRFYDPDSGKILLDGVDLKSVKRDSLRSRMGVVLQDATMFHTTIRENIRYGRLDATDAEVEQAAKSAMAHEFITQLPDGYDTTLDSDGKGVSHGQRQLLSIARAMIADPSLLILDEATSSIDTVTEMKINAGLTNLMKGRTSFVIAHRLHTIRSADVILVLKSGKVVEKGDHRTLMAHGGEYAALIRAQTSDKNQRGYG